MRCDIVQPVEGEDVVLLDQFTESPAASVLGNLHMKIQMVAVYGVEKICVADIETCTGKHRVQLLGHSRKLPTLGWRGSKGAKAGGVSLERFPNFAAVDDILLRRYTHASSCARAAFEKSFTFEYSQSLRDGEVAHPEFLGKRPAGNRNS